MARYGYLFNLKPDSVARMIDHPSDRVAAVSKVLEPLGGKVEAYYWLFGQFDGFVVAEVPDSVTAAAVSLVVASSGAFSHVETHEIIAPDEMDAALTKARTARGEYQAPGS
jgi:uncharacterized protein with GYD domain